MVFPRAVREAMDAGARLHAGAARGDEAAGRRAGVRRVGPVLPGDGVRARAARLVHAGDELGAGPVARLPDRKSTRLNSSHLVISYSAFFFKKKKKKPQL